MRLYILLQLRSTLVVDRLRLVVESAIPENFQDIVTELFPVSILAVAELLFDCLEIDGLLHNQMIVRNVFK
jgi:hypothetical protein